MPNIGVLGLGFMAATHLKAYRKVPEARIISLCNPSGRNLDGDFSRVAGNVGTNEPFKLDMTGVRPFQDVKEFLAQPDLDIVDICAPTPAHETLAIAALRAGKHVLCEKPLARDSATAGRIAAVARESKGFFMPAMCMRFWPGWDWLKTALTEQRYGKVLAARFRRVAEPPAWGQKNFLDGTHSGGALFDLHIHDVDIVQHCFGVPRRVMSSGYSFNSGAIDHVFTQYQVASGAAVTSEGGWTMGPGFGFSMAYTVNCEQATLDYDLARAERALLVFEPGREPQVIPCSGDDGYVGELRYFVTCVASGEKPSRVTIDDALNAVRICEAEEGSVHSGSPVAVNA
jgi:predicted dehydrogenase